uniref:Mon2/Sec7/BIG1-like HUS domain-containing protein n=1 Tax=Bodo saltans TaxID=75058 RepID=B6DTH7_BODSA|nr:hypothetical protein [Bodo saltans]
MATLVVGESINVKSMWIPALDAVSKALEKARALESNKEQRYLLRLVSTEIQQQQQLLATALSTTRVTSTSTAVAAASPPASPGRPTSAGSVSPQRGQTGVTSAANGAPAAATTSGIDELSFTMNRVATVVRGYLLHTLAQNRSNQRIVEATLELSHALLNSGVLPVDAQWAPANIPIPSSVNASMLTKMLGTWGSRSTTTEPHAEGSAAPHPPSVAAATMNPFDEIATLNVKVALCVPNQIESPGLYTAITSLLGAVVPDRVSCIDRTCPQQTSFIPSGSFIGLSGPALQTHAYLLFALAVRATTSNMPTLLTIVKGGLSRLIGAIVKELDRHHNRAVRGSSMGPLAADSTNPTPSTRSVTPTPTTSSNALNQHLRSSSVAPQQQGRYEPATVTLHHDVAVLIGIATYFTSDTLMAASKDDISKLIALVPISLTRSSESRALCLTYILQFFVNGGPGMRKSPILLHCIQQTLFPAVLKTALSNEIDVYRLSLNILFTLYNNFYAELMVECGMFFQHVLFQILASQNASVSQKVLALEVVKLIAEEPKNLLNMYLNYDCDTNSTNVYETLLYHLDVLATGTSKRTRGGDQATSPLAKTTGSSSAAASTGSTPPPTAARVPQLQRLALDTLLCIAEAHHQWVERFVEGGTKQPTPSYVESSPSPNVGAMLSEGDVDTNDETTTTTAALTTSLAPHFVGLGAMDGDGDLLSAEPSYSNFSASTVTMSGMDLSHVFDTKKKKRLTEKFLKLFNTEKSAERALAFLEGDGQDILPSDETLPEPLSRDRRAASYAALKNTTTSVANP